MDRKVIIGILVFAFISAIVFQLVTLLKTTHTTVDTKSSPTSAVNLSSELLKVPDIPSGPNWTEVTSNLELNNLIAQPKDGKRPSFLSLDGHEYSATGYGLDDNFGNWLYQNGWKTEVPSFNIGDIQFSTIDAAGPGGWVTCFYKIVGEKVRIVNTSTNDDDIPPGNKAAKRIFISRIYSKDELVKLVNK